MAFLLFSACSKNQNENGKIKIVTTIFPEYDWVREIVGKTENVEITLLLDTGVDLHSYQPSVQSMAKLSSADIFVYVGGESDDWVRNALKSAKNKNMIVVNLLSLLGEKVKEEELVEGMQEESEESEDEEEIEYDEHVWLSVKNAQIICAQIAEILCAFDSKNADFYRANVSSYLEKLSALDAEYYDAIFSSANKTILFGDRFPFRYLADDYALKYYAAFVGCSAETEASFKTIAFLSNKVDELSLPVVFKIESGDGKIAQTIIQNTKSKNAKILTLDSMQSVTKTDIANGATYLTIMEKNLDVLKAALK